MQPAPAFSLLTDVSRWRIINAHNLYYPPMDTMQQIERFTDELRRQEKAPNTIESYRSDLVLLSRWLEATNGEPFEASRITPTDLREYRAYLLTVEQRSPATINRRLASLRTFFQWARAEGLCRELPTDAIKGIQSSPR